MNRYWQKIMLLRHSFKKFPANTGWFLATALLGAGLRIYITGLGFNWDMTYWIKYSEAIGQGGNYYKKVLDEHAAGWPVILYLLDLLPNFGMTRFWSLKYKITIVLTLVDIAIAYLLWREYSIRAAALMLLNPISILITGYHTQIDTIYVLCGIVAVRLIRKNEQKVNYAGLAILGLSLIMKHGLFLFPAWIAFRACMKRRWWVAAASMGIPYSLFLLSFVFFLDSRLPYLIPTEIIQYRSVNNYPLLHVLQPFLKMVPVIGGFILSYTPFQVFIFTLCVLGICWHKRPLEEMLYLYLLSLVVFSSAIANQYLSIVSAAIAVYPNIFFMLYMLTGSIFLIGDVEGMNIPLVSQAVRQVAGGDRMVHYEILITVLFAGLLLMQAKKWWPRRKEIWICLTRHREMPMKNSGLRN
jgi:hypothetical protein